LMAVTRSDEIPNVTQTKANLEARFRKQQLSYPDGRVTRNPESRATLRIADSSGVDGDKRV
jgi:hypothetical protein